MFFKLMKWMSAWIIVLLTTSGILMAYIMQGQLLQDQPQLFQWMFQYSICNLSNQQFTLITKFQDISILGFILLFQILRYNLRYLNKTLKHQVLQIEDFSVLLTNIQPNSQTEFNQLEEELSVLISSKFKNCSSNQFQIYFKYDMDSFNIFHHKRNSLRKEYKQKLVDLYKNNQLTTDNKQQLFDWFDKKMLEIQFEYLKYISQISDYKWKYLEGVYVFFYNREQRNRFIREYGVKRQWVTFRAAMWLVQKLCGQTQNQKKRQLRFKNQKLIVEKPNYLEDILNNIPPTHHNQQNNNHQQNNDNDQQDANNHQQAGPKQYYISLNLRILICAMINISISLISYIFFSLHYQSPIMEEHDSNNRDNNLPFIIYSAICSILCLSVVDKLIEQLIPETLFKLRSHRQQQLMILNVFTKFYQLALTPIIIKYFLKNESNSFHKSAVVIALSSQCFFSFPLLISTLVSPQMLFKQLCFWICKYRFFYLQRLKLDQQQANEYFEMPSFELYLQLANMIVIQWMSMFFYSVSLWVIAVQIIIMFGYYWGQKYNFIRKRCIGIQNQYRLIKVTMDLIEVSLCLFCLMNFLITTPINKQLNTASLLALLIGVLYMFIPTGKVNSYFFSKNNFLYPSSDSHIFNKYSLFDNISLFKQEDSSNSSNQVHHQHQQQDNLHIIHQR